MKKIALLLSVFVLTVAINCENEPLEEGIQSNEPDDSGACTDAAQDTAAAAQAYGQVDDTNFTSLCIAYKAAIQAQVTACGDPDGLLQALSDSLGDCSNDPGTDDCDSAAAASVEAQAAFDMATNDNYTDLCSAYVAALDNQINLCGDADGSIQAIIDSLGDCSISNSTGDYWPMAVGNTWIYNVTIDGLEQPESVLEILVLEDYLGQPSYRYDGAVGTQLATDGSEFQNLDVKYYSRKNGGDYTVLVGEVSAEIPGAYQITQSPFDYILLKDYLDPGSSWRHEFDVVTSYTPIGGLPGLPDTTLSYTMDLEILEKDVSVPVDGTTYDNVIKVGLLQHTVLDGFPESSITADFIYYFARDIGLVQIEGTIFDADDNITSVVLQTISAYSLN